MIARAVWDWLPHSRIQAKVHVRAGKNHRKQNAEDYGDLRKRRRGRNIRFHRRGLAQVR